MQTLIKTLALLLLLGCTLYQANAQCSRWKKNNPNWQFRTALGLTPTFIKDHVDAEVPPVSLELRYRPHPKFSIGLLAGTSVSNTTQEHHTGVRQSFRNTFRMYALRAGVHSQRWEKWDAYGGLVLAYQNNTVTSTAEGKTPLSEPPIHFVPRKTGFFYSAFLGTAYRPYPQIELFGELSYGLSIVTVGAGFSW